MGTSPDSAFLYAAIDDLQGTVRAIDIKAEVLLLGMTVPLSDLSGGSVAVWEMITKGHLIIRVLSLIASVGLVVSWITAFIATCRVLVGSHNPADAIPDHAPAKGAFFAGSLFKFKVMDLLRDRLVPGTRTLQQHIDSLPNDPESVVAELAFEQLKLAFICARKIAMFNFAVRLTVFGVYAGVALLLLRIFE
jgi:hypothetical protein